MAKKKVFGMTRGQCEILEGLIDRRNGYLTQAKVESVMRVLEYTITCNRPLFPNWTEGVKYRGYLKGMINSLSNAGVYFPLKNDLLVMANNKYPPQFPFRNITGSEGIISARVVEEVLSGYDVSIEKLEKAINRIAREIGQDGVKIIGNNGIVAELKIKSMKKHRIYCNVDKKPFYFNIVDKHL